MTDRDRFVNVRKGKALLVGSKAVALLKPDWAKENDIRCGKNKVGTMLYSVIDIAAYVERVTQERADAALESSDVRAWRFVADQAAADGNAEAEKWANGHLLKAIAASSENVFGVDAITLE